MPKTMTAVVPLPSRSEPRPGQHFLFPQRLTWEKFKALDRLVSSYTLRLSYLDGQVELMSLSPEHETTKCLLALLLGLYFLECDISFTPTGSATIEREAESSKEPDLSYRFGENRRQQDVPDLAIEIIFTSGGIDKLSYYQRLGVAEVWLWEDGVFSVYGLGDNGGEAGYERLARSVVLPELDLELLARCLNMAEEKEAMKQFRAAIRRG